MFRTFDVSKVELPPVFEKSDRQYWNCVELVLDVPYFHAHFEPKEDDESEERGGTFIYQSLGQLLEVLENSTLHVSSVLLLSPGRLNGTDSWKLEALDHVLGGIDRGKHDEKMAMVFVLKNGNRYLDAFYAESESDLSSVKTLAEIPGD